MATKNRVKKEHDKAMFELLEAFESHRRRTVELGRLRSKHRALLSALASITASSRGDVEKVLNKELDRQERELLVQKNALDKTHKVLREKRRSIRPKVVEPLSHSQYKDYPYAVGSYMLIRPDQYEVPPEDLSGCGPAGDSKKFWKIGWYYLYDDRILSDPPTLGVHFTIVPFPLKVNEPMPYPTNERPWLDTYYAVDGPVSPELRMGAQGANGGAHFTVAYGIDIAEWGGCGIEFLAESEVSGIVDVGGYSTSEHIFPHVDFSLNIDVYQYRCLGAPISTVDLNNTTVYRSWHAFPLLSWEQPDDYSVTELGLYSIEPFRANIFKQTKDVKAGDSFLFVYTGSVFASESGVQLSHNNIGTWIIREPVLKVHYYPPTPDYNKVVVNPSW